MSYLAVGDQPFGPRGADYKAPEPKTYDTPPADAGLLQKSFSAITETAKNVINTVTGKTSGSGNGKTIAIVGVVAVGAWLLTRKK